MSTKRYKLACAPIKDIDQHPHSLIRVFNGRSMGSQGSNISLGRKLRLIRLCKCADCFEHSLNAHANMYIMLDISSIYSRTCANWPLSKRQKIGFQDPLSLNAGQKYCRMLQGEHSAILLTFNNLPFVIKIFVLSILSGCFTHGLLYG